MPGKPCVYIALNSSSTGAYSPAVRAKLALVGKPTIRPHNERYVLAWQKMIRKAKQDDYARRNAATRGMAASPRRIEIAQAQREYDRREWVQLVTWVRRWAHIFWE